MPILDKVTLAGQSFPAAPTSLGRADMVWPGYEAALGIGGVRSMSEAIGVARGLLFAACRAANPSFAATTLDQLKGVRPKELFAEIRRLAPIFGTNDPSEDAPEAKPVTEIPTTITLGDRTLRIAPIELGQAQEIWPAFDIAVKQRGEVPFREQVRALRKVVFACCAAADPNLTEEDFLSIQGVNAFAFFRLITPLAYLLGYLDFEEKDASQGEATAGETPAS
jgi:hypothetical protein